jgi:hypothetical protein
MIPRISTFLDILHIWRPSGNRTMRHSTVTVTHYDAKDFLRVQSVRFYIEILSVLCTKSGDLTQNNPMCLKFHDLVKPLTYSFSNYSKT